MGQDFPPICDGRLGHGCREDGRRLSDWLRGSGDPRGLKTLTLKGLFVAPQRVDVDGVTPVGQVCPGMSRLSGCR